MSPSLCLKVTLETGNFTVSRISENVVWFMPDCTFPKIDIWCAINTQTLDMNCSCKTSGNAKSLHIVLSVIRRTDPVYAGEHGGDFRGSNHCYEWRKPLNIEIFGYFLRMKIDILQECAVRNKQGVSMTTSSKLSTRSWRCYQA